MNFLIMRTGKKKMINVDSFFMLKKTSSKLDGIGNSGTKLDRV